MKAKDLCKTNVDGLPGLKTDNDYRVFYYRTRIDGKLYSKTINLTGKSWAKRDRIRNAIAEALAFKDSKLSGATDLFTADTKLDIIAGEYFKVQPSTQWTSERHRQYQQYIQPYIGGKSIGKIIPNDIDRIRKRMEAAGHGTQNKDGCSPRTIHKVLIQTLKPIMVYARDNGAITAVPAFNIKKPKSKKRVKDGIGKLSLLYRTIMELYADDPFYRALFLLAIQGRRWNEIRTLQWENIDFTRNFYTIEAEHNKIGEDQDYDLWHPIREALEELSEDTGLVFKSPVTGRELHSPKKQLARIKAAADMPELTMHLFRHIAVTALGENGVPGTVLSAALGHTDSTTVDKHYRTLNHLKGSKDASIAMDAIVDAEVVE